MAITKRYRAKHYERMYAALMITFCSKKRHVSAPLTPLGEAVATI